jgi:hypothetical protein
MHSYIAASALLLWASFRLGGSQSIDPNSVPKPTREKWCNDQRSTCPLLCLQIPGERSRPQQNDCNPDNLAYTCICANGQQPNASEFSLTIPYHQCQESNNQCERACPTNDATCQAACRTSNPCGAQNPARVNTSTSSAMEATSRPTAAPTGDAEDSDSEPTAVYTGFGSDPTASADEGSGNTNSAQALVLGFGHTYGLFIVLTAVCGSFTLML